MGHSSHLSHTIHINHRMRHFLNQVIGLARKVRPLLLWSIILALQQRNTTMPLRQALLPAPQAETEGPLPLVQTTPKRTPNRLQDQVSARSPHSSVDEQSLIPPNRRMTTRVGPVVKVPRLERVTKGIASIHFVAAKCRQRAQPAVKADHSAKGILYQGHRRAGKTAVAVTETVGTARMTQLRNSSLRKDSSLL